MCTVYVYAICSGREIRLEKMNMLNPPTPQQKNPPLIGNNLLARTSFLKWKMN